MSYYKLARELFRLISQLILLVNETFLLMRQ